MAPDKDEVDLMDVMVLGFPIFFLTLGVIFFVAGLVKLVMIT
jgi:hypothetical protein